MEKKTKEYYIEFHYLDGSYPEKYGGGQYTFQGEKYAVLNNDNPKLYKSPKIAARSAESLITTCANTGCRYIIRHVTGVAVYEQE